MDDVATETAGTGAAARRPGSDAVLPNAFIVGAPKCATTAMTRWLDAHPRAACLAKELHVFGSDLELRRPGGRMALEEYRRRAAEKGRGGDVVVDASVYYLFSKTAAAEIRAFNPDARIIVMLRRPADMLRSLHQQNRKSLDEDIEDFGAALAAEPDRAAGRRVPPGAIAVCSLRYRALARFAEQIERYRAVFPPEQVLVLLYDDLVRDAAGEYARVCRFLGVEPDPDARLEPVNEAATVRNRLLVDFQRRVIYRYDLYRWAGRLMPRALRRPLDRLWRGMLYARSGRTPADPALMDRLTEEFAPEVRRLEALLGRDLSAWRTPAR